jgi:hypothetical protein
MLNDRARARLIGAWFAAVAVTIAGNMILGATVTLGTSVLLLAASLVLPTILLLVWRGATPLTVAELLYSVNTQPKDGRA